MRCRKVGAEVASNLVLSLSHVCVNVTRCFCTAPPSGYLYTLQLYTVVQQQTRTRLHLHFIESNLGFKLLLFVVLCKLSLFGLEFGGRFFVDMREFLH